MAPLEHTPGTSRVALSINTDNPLTFATCLADEYTHLYCALVREGVPATVAQEWLDRAREAGWRSRFTLEASADPEVLDAFINAWGRSGRMPVQ
jgi:hypothetical protein